MRKLNPSFFEWLRQVPHRRPEVRERKDGTVDTNPHNSTPFFRRTRAKLVRSRQARFILIGPDWRATIYESYITYLHFDDNYSVSGTSTQ